MDNVIRIVPETKEEVQKRLRDHIQVGAWRPQIMSGITDLVNALPIDESHVLQTPFRFVAALQEYLSGYLEDPASYLQTAFARGNYDEMIHVRDINLASMCAHHLAPILGKVHFAYVPDGHIVGLSKIPRMINAIGRRLQVQEDITEQIVNTFQEVVQPNGCAVFVRAAHLCMSYRGVKEHAAVTETVALRGCFKSSYQTRAEFLQSLDRREQIFP